MPAAFLNLFLSHIYYCWHFLKNINHILENKLKNFCFCLCVFFVCVFFK